jgi:hypothetical protein
MPELLDQDLTTKLQAETAATKVSTKKFGVRRALPKEKTQQAALTFGASVDSLRATKRLIDPSSAPYLAVSAVFYQINQFWKNSTIPYPESGIRLLRRDRIDEFNSRMVVYRAELDQATAALQEAYEGIRNQAEADLGSLFDEADYPTNIAEEFSVDWEFPSVKPPNFLKQLNPELYAQQEARLAAKFDEAIAMTERAFSNEFSGLVEHLFDRLQPQSVEVWVYQNGPSTAELEAQAEAIELELPSADGSTAAFTSDVEALNNRLSEVNRRAALSRAGAIEVRDGDVSAIPEKGRRTTFKFDDKEAAAAWLTECGCRFERTTMEHKTFRDSAVGGLRDFFDRFGQLNIGSNAALDQLVQEAKALVGGVDPTKLRSDEDTRLHISNGLRDLKDRMETMLIDRPTRAITFDDEV